MAITYTGATSTIAQLGAELKGMRLLEAAYDWLTRVDGSTYVRDLLNVAYVNSVADEDQAESDSKASLKDNISPDVLSKHAQRVSDFETYWLATYLAALTDAKQSDIDAGAITYLYNEALEETGEISVQDRTGMLGVLWKDVSAQRKKFIRNALTIGTLTANPAGTNVGVLVATTKTGDDNTLGGTVNVACTDETVGAVKCSVGLTLTLPLRDASLTAIREAEKELTVGKTFRDPITGMVLLLDLDTPVITGDAGSIFSVLSVANPSGNDSDFGRYYIEVERMSGTGGDPDFRVRWYRLSNFTVAANLVATEDVTGVAGSVVLVISGNGSVITVTFSKTNAAAALPVVDDKDSDIIFDLKSPREGDSWTISIANDEAGKFATKFARRWPIAFPSGPAKPTTNCAGALAGAGAGNVDNGTHSYKYTFIASDLKESGGADVSNTVTVADKTVDGKVDLSSIDTGPAGTTKRRIYRTIAGAAVTGPWKFLAEIADNVTTTYQDNIADANLGEQIYDEIDDTLATSISLS